MQAAAPEGERGAEAVLEDTTGPDVEAVRCWLNEFVIRLDFCPWAKTADAAEGIRITSSLSSTVEGVLADLKAEAAALRDGSKAAARTTLLVCPKVEAWQDFRCFHAFFVWYLDNGFALGDEYGVKVVPFHPQYALESDLKYKVGDRVIIPGADGNAAVGHVLNLFAGIDDVEESCFTVLLESGQEATVRHAAMLARAPSAPADEDDVLNVSSRAPRPVLHLLRMDDMDKALKDAGGSTEAVLDRNEFKLLQLGSRGAARMMRKYG